MQRTVEVPSNHQQCVSKLIRQLITVVRNAPFRLCLRGLLLLLFKKTVGSRTCPCIMCNMCNMSNMSNMTSTTSNQFVHCTALHLQGAEHCALHCTAHQCTAHDCTAPNCTAHKYTAYHLTAPPGAEHSALRAPTPNHPCTGKAGRAHSFHSLCQVTLALKGSCYPNQLN